MIGKKKITILYNNRRHEIEVDMSHDACIKFGSCLSGNRMYDPVNRQMVFIEGVQFVTPWAKVVKGNLVLWATPEGASVSTKYNKKTVARLRKPSKPEHVRK